MAMFEPGDVGTLADQLLSISKEARENEDYNNYDRMRKAGVDAMHCSHIEYNLFEGDRQYQLEVNRLIGRLLCLT